MGTRVCAASPSELSNPAGRNRVPCLGGGFEAAALLLRDGQQRGRMVTTNKGSPMTAADVRKPQIALAHIAARGSPGRDNPHTSHRRQHRHSAGYITGIEKREGKKVTETKSERRSL